MRHLIELLDGEVGIAYEEAGLVYRQRYSPVMRVLMLREPCTIGYIADVSGITQPAVTRTIALMIKEGLIRTQPCAEDARQKLIWLTESGRLLLPRMQSCWHAAEAATRELEAELGFPLSQILEETTRALECKSFDVRVRAVRSKLPNKTADAKPTFGSAD